MCHMSKQPPRDNRGRQSECKLLESMQAVLRIFQIMISVLGNMFSNRVTFNNKARQESTSMSVPASSAQIPTGHAHSVNRSGGVIALSHSDFSPNTRKRGSFAKMD
ncbi:hypothetical protein BD560DRAFT_486884 [Blakeslea trispora]|nr:hypothetical protein BD560DRAFT_486884 [Blakeslea trispora]